MKFVSNYLLLFALCGLNRGKMISEVLKELFLGPLLHENLLVVIEEELIRPTQLNLLLQKFSQMGYSQYVLLTSKNFSQTPEEIKNLSSLKQESKFMLLIVFSGISVQISESLENQDWQKPDYCLLVNTNSSFFYHIEEQKFEIVNGCKYLSYIQQFTTPLNNSRYVVYHSKYWSASEPKKKTQKLVGPWVRNNFLTKDRLFARPLNGQKLYLASFCDDFPFLYIKENKCIGSNIALLEYITSKFNVSFEVQIATSDNNIIGFKNGSWTGPLKDLAYNKKDLLINSAPMIEDYTSTFDLTYPYKTEIIIIALAIPPKVPRWLGIFYPFTLLTWAAIGITLIFTIIGFYALLYFGNELHGGEDIIYITLMVTNFCFIRENNMFCQLSNFLILYTLCMKVSKNKIYYFMLLLYYYFFICRILHHCFDNHILSAGKRIGADNGWECGGWHVLC